MYSVTDFTDLPWLDRYLARELTDAERAEVNAWLTERPETAREVRGVDRAVHVAGQVVGDAELAVFVARMREVRMRESHQPMHTPLHRHPSSGRRMLPAVMGMALTIGLVGTLMVSRMTHQNTELSGHRYYSTMAGQRATVRLADGTTALLAPMTTLHIGASATGASATTVSATSVSARVRGEVLFSVIHHREQRFEVETRNTRARVLGTTFLVRQYDTEPRSRIVVTDGKVSVANININTNSNASVSHSPIVLTTGTMAAVSDSGPIAVTPRISADDYTAWTNGSLVFRDTPLLGVLTELSRAYGVEIRCQDSTLATHTFTFTATVGLQSLSDVLNTLMLPLEAHYTQLNRTITILPGRPVVHRRTLHPLSSEMSYGR